MTSPKVQTDSAECKRNPWIGGLLSFFAPGAGHIYVGAARRGLIFISCFFLGLIFLGRILGLFSAYPWGPFILFGLVIIFYITVIIDAVRLARARQKFVLKKYNKWYVYVASVIVIFLIFEGVFSKKHRAQLLGYDLYRIPSGAMTPTLEIGDFIVVDTRDKTPKRGDVIVFRYPKDPSIPFVKRVVGLPSDHIEYDSANKMLYINNEPVTQSVVGRYIGEGASSSMTGQERRIEYLPMAEHAILVSRNMRHAPKSKWVIPDNAYFVLGDNRDNSKDSRFWGTVPLQNVIGKVTYIWMSWDWSAGGIRSEKIGSRVK